MCFLGVCVCACVFEWYVCILVCCFHSSARAHMYVYTFIHTNNIFIHTNNFFALSLVFPLYFWSGALSIDLLTSSHGTSCKCCVAVRCSMLQCAAMWCSVSHSHTHCNTLHHANGRMLQCLCECETLQHIAAHCNILQNTAKHCNLLPLMSRVMSGISRRVSVGVIAVCCKLLQVVAMCRSVMQFLDKACVCWCKGETHIYIYHKKKHIYTYYTKSATIADIAHPASGSVLQCAVVFCSALQCVAVCCSMLQYVAERGSVWHAHLHTVSSKSYGECRTSCMRVCVYVFICDMYTCVYACMCVCV